MSETRAIRWRGTVIAAIAVLLAQLVFAFIEQPFGPAAKAALWIFGAAAFFGGGLAFFDSVRSCALRGKDK